MFGKDFKSFFPHTIFSMYLGLVSLYAFVWAVITFGVMFSSIAEKVIISDSEYAMSHGRNYYFDLKVDENSKEKRIQETIVERNYRFKTDMIEVGAFFAVFLVLFWTHFCRFRKVVK